MHSEWKKDSGILLVLITVPCLLIGAYLHFNQLPFTLCNDQFYQYDLFYREWYRLLTGFSARRELPLYSWTMYLGTDFFSSMSYYCTGDLLFLLCFPLIRDIEGVKSFLTFETVVCIYLSAVSFYWCLKQRGVNKRYVLLCSALIYAFGGWSVSYYGIYMFHRFYAVFPFLIGGAEYYFRTKRKWILIVSTAVLFLQNFYFMYPASIFLLLYCIMRELQRNAGVKEFCADAGKMLYSYLIGLMIASVVLVPAVLATLSNSRVGTGSEGLFWQLKTYLGILLSPVNSPFPEFTKYNNLFYIDGGSHDYWFSINIGILLFIYALDYCAAGEHKAERCVLLVLLLCLVLKPLSSVMHGFSEPSLRWMFCLQFYLQILGTKQYERSEGKTRIFVLYSLLTLAVFVYLMMQYPVSQYPQQFLVMILCLVVSAVTWMIHLRSRYLGMLWSVCWMLALSGMYTVVRTSQDYRYRVLIDLAETAYYDSLDDESVYRYYIPSDDMMPSGVLSGNTIMDYGMMSSKTYNTMYDPATDAFNRKTGNPQHFISVDDPYALTMIGTKYWVVNDENELPEELAFEFVHPLSYLKVYRNMDYHGFAYTVPTVEPIEKWTDNRMLMDTLFVEDLEEEIQDGDAEMMQISYHNGHYLEGTIDLDTMNILFVALPDNPGWQVRVDGTETETMPVNGGFIGIPLEAGNHLIQMNFITRGLKEGLILTAAGTILFLAAVLRDHKKASV